MAENGNKTTIIVDHVSKNFRIYKDKSHTFKDRILFSKRNHYELNKVLNDISFTVQAGEAVGLIGHNGCGKSTTLKLLNRILYPDKGTITMNGRISSLIELGAGFHPDMTGRENIYINASIFGLKRPEIDDKLEDIIRFSELEQFIDNPVRTYSSGMYMRLAFAIAINVNADILLVDEILAVGDANFQQKCFDKMQEIKAGGTTIVIVSHSMDQIRSICDRVLWIDKGQLHKQGDAVTVCNEYLYEMERQAAERARAEMLARGETPEEDPNILYPVFRIAPQAGEYACRRGNMKVRYQSLLLCDESGQACTNFAYGAPMLLRYELTADDESDAFAARYPIELNLRIFTYEEGRMCTWMNTLAEYGERRDWRSMRKGTFRIPRLQLAEGRYILDVTIVGENVQDHDVLLHLIEFNVTTDPRKGRGIAAMDNEWTFEV